MRLYFFIWGIVWILCACESKKRPVTTDPFSAEIPKKLLLSGPVTLNSGDCTAFAVKTVDALETEKATPLEMNVLLRSPLDSAFFSDLECSVAVTETKVAVNTSTTTLYFNSLVPGTLSLQASEKKERLLPNQISVIVLPVVDVTISNGPTYNFGSAYLGTILEKTFTVSNGGKNVAASLTASALSTPFAFKGGTYPGTGGTCATSLNASHECSLVLTFTPTSLGSSATSIVLNYSDGVTLRSASRPLVGEGVTSGSLDSTFGQSGKVTTAGASSEDRAMSVVVEPGGKVVIAGSSIRSSTSYDTALVKYNIEGHLDTSFGSGGIAIHSLLGTEDRALGLVRRSDGKFVTGGYGYVSGNYDYLVARFNTDGSLDTSFGTGGKTTTAVGTSHDYGFAISQFPNGRLVMGGYSYDSTASRYNMAVVKYLEDGAVDSAFGTAGKATVSVGSGSSYCFAVLIVAGNRIVCVGHASVAGSDIAVVKFNSDGSLDTSFGSSGKVTIDINSSTDYGYGAAVQSDGKILITGSAGFGGRSYFAAVRLNTDGSLDSSFDFDGKLYYALGPNLDEARSVQVQSNGRIILAGHSYNGLDYDFSVTRLFTDGAMDTSFGSSGKLITPMGSGNDRIFASAIDDFGRIVTVGDTLVGSTLDFALARYLP